MTFDDAKLNETICGLKSFARYYGGNTYWVKVGHKVTFVVSMVILFR